MAWTTPRTWTAGEIVTAAILNAHVRDNLNALYASTPGAGNLLHNGQMRVHQRGTGTASITTGGFYTADRWSVSLSALGTWTQTIENDAPTGSGFRKSLKMVCTTADASPAVSDLAAFTYGIEGQNLQAIKKGTASAQQVTLSFWVKSNKTGVYVAELNDVDNTRSVSAAYTVSSSATWEQKTITFPADTSGALDNDNAASLYLNFWLAAGTNYTSGTLATTWASTTNANRAVGQTNLASATTQYLQITGVQLEVGSAASGFEFKDYGRELGECQRYYWVLVSGIGKAPCAMVAQSTNRVWSYITAPTTMRATPTLVTVDGTNYYGFNRSGSEDLFDSLSIDAAQSSEQFHALYNTNTGDISVTAGQAGVLETNSSASLIAFSSEI